MPLARNCKICDKGFFTKPYFVKQGWGKYCSAACQYKGAKKGGTKMCFICEKVTYKTVTQLKRSESGKYFCGKSCQTKWRNEQFVGEKHANWKTGLHVYRSILRRNHIPKICRLCRTKDERVLAVHHIDKNRKNNKLNNLAWLCHNCHFLVHHHGAGKNAKLLK